MLDPDPAVIRFILREQDIRGDILEIGCNLGRTAVLLGDYLREDEGETLCVCGEWREALQPRALPEPDVNLAIHPAPIIQP